jgi:CBS domain-containing protein
MHPTGTVDSILQHKGHQVWSVTPDHTVFEAIQLMADKNVGALLVVEEGRPVGVVSERDYARKVALQGKHSRETVVRDVTSGRLITVTRGQTVADCMRLMTEHRIRHLPVVEEGAILGLISIGDLVNWIINSQNATIDQLRSYISGEYPN